MASLVQGWKVSYAPYAATPPTTGWIELKNIVRNAPNLFPEGDSIDTSTVDNITPTSIASPGTGDALDFTVLPTPDMMTAHKAMVTDQTDSAKGYFWLRVDYTTDNRRVQFPATTALNMPTSENGFGELEEVTLPMYAAGDKEDITPIPATL